MGLSESRAPPIPRDHHHILPKKERLQYPLSNKPISDLKLLLSHIMCIYIYIHIIIIYVSYSGGSLLLGQTMYIFCSIYFYICLYISTYFYINSSYFYILLYTSIFFHMFLYIYIYYVCWHLPWMFRTQRLAADCGRESRAVEAWDTGLPKDGKNWEKW